ncbi:MAG: hypothetical protein OCC49_02085 [Fibrobacterales bacterium]
MIKHETLLDVKSEYDLVIIGAGPGGLGVAASLKGKLQNYLLVDSGKHVKLRDRYHGKDLTCGYGGAGLFSDGKFSFFPSASELWKLPKQKQLSDSYSWVTKQLSSYSMKVPPYPKITVDEEERTEKWVLKDYPSEFLSLEDRYALTDALVEESDGECLEETNIDNITYLAPSNEFILAVSSKGEQTTTIARSILFASGRFGPIDMQDYEFIDTKFRRLEVGFRIEQPDTKSFFYKLDQIDPKLKFAQPRKNVEWRTFCACRSGETVLSDTLGFSTVSGRTDCPPTGISNIGFNTRIKDEQTAQRVWNIIKHSMKKKASYYRMPLNELYDSQSATSEKLGEIMGNEARALMIEGVANLGRQFPEIHDPDTCIIGPTLEGVGWYPVLDENLKVPGVPAWVIGDAAGSFRGIVAAMISGHYCSDEVTEYITEKEREVCSQLLG